MSVVVDVSPASHEPIFLLLCTIGQELLSCYSMRLHNVSVSLGECKMLGRRHSTFLVLMHHVSHLGEH
jgi:hypothetical protein